MFHRQRRYARAAAAVAAALLAATGCGSGNGGDTHSRPPEKPRQERWRIDYTTASTDTTLFDIAAAGKDDTWAMGQESQHYVLYHRHNGPWRPARLPLPDPKAVLFNIELDASAPDNVWLFAGSDSPDTDTDDDEGTPLARRWDGHQWHTVPVTFNPRDTVVLAPDDVWALDSGLNHDNPDTRHWDGKHWTTHDLPFPAAALSASGPHDIWAVGERNDPTGRTQNQPAIAHFDGGKWRSAPLPADRFAKRGPHEQSELTEVVAISPDNAWAFGSHFYLPENSSASDHRVSTGWHWDGRRWKKAAGVPDPRIGLSPFPEMVATTDGAGGFVLGGHQHGDADGRIRVIDDPSPKSEPTQSSTPTEQATGSPPRPTFELTDLQRVPGTREVWASGYLNAPDVGSDARRGAVAVCTLNG